MVVRKNPNNFFDDYFKTRLIWEAPTGARAQTKRKTNSIIKDAIGLPKNVFKITGQQKYRTLGEIKVGENKEIKYIGIYDTIEEALEAQLIWEKLNERRRSRIDL